MPPLRRCQPIAVGPKRSIRHPVLMPALQFRNPIRIFIQMKANNFPQRSRCLHEFHIRPMCTTSGHTSR